MPSTSIAPLPSRRRTIVRKRRDPTLISAPPRFSWTSVATVAPWSPVRSRASSTRWIPISKARSFGRGVSAKVALQAACNGAPPRTRKMFMPRYPMCACSPSQSAAVTAIPGVVFSGGLDGHLRAYSTNDGGILWDVDTMADFKTVNQVKAHGGSLDGPGPIIAGGILYVNSGYAFAGSAPGNVLLAFSVEGK